MPPTLLLDVDGTLAPLNHAAAAGKVRELLVGLFGSKGGEQANKDFLAVYEAIDSLHHGRELPEFVRLRNKLNSYGVKLPPELGGKEVNFMWSRELWLKYISDNRNLDLSWEKIIELIDAYWEANSLHSPLYPDIRPFLENSIKQCLKMFLITASDRRLTYRGGSVTYDPEISGQKKIRRVLEQGLSVYFKPGQVITGDPFNKPGVEFWEKCMTIASLSRPSDAIVIDDAKAVVASAVDFGFRGCVLDRKSHYDRSEIESRGIDYITKFNQLEV